MSGCKMAYGSGTSLTGLSFTPIVAIFTGILSEYIPRHFFICTSGSSGYPTCHIVKDTNSTEYAGYIKCTFGSNSVTVSKYGEFNWPVQLGYIVAFGT